MNLSVPSGICLASQGIVYVLQMEEFNLVNPFCGETTGNLLLIIKITEFNSKILYRIARIDLLNARFSTSLARNVFRMYTTILFLSAYRIRKKCYCQSGNVSFCDVCFDLAVAVAHCINITKLLKQIYTKSQAPCQRGRAPSLFINKIKGKVALFWFYLSIFFIMYKSAVKCTEA